jgi:glycosyltransferase involved in cell wall biosynthesis
VNAHGQIVCLTMIVKDEALVIRRCLDSVRPIVDRWVVVDTGSSDGTQEIVREHLRDLPGMLVERPWVDFAHNRTEAIEYARDVADYLFVIDADEVLQLDEGFELPRLEADSYNAEVLYGGCSYHRKQLIRAALPWRYRGLVHEYLECPQARSEAFLPGMRTIPHRDGARARNPGTYRNDAKILERALAEEPGNARTAFYLAQSYRDAGDLEEAVAAYRRRAEMGGWPEEVWYSLYQAAQLEERLGRPWPEVMQGYLAAHQYKPDRAGPLFRIGIHYAHLGQHELAHLFLGRAMRIAPPASDRLFVERPLYDYAVALEYAVACHYVGDYAEAIAVNNRLLRSPALPPELGERVVRNRRFSVDAVAPAPRPGPPPPVTVGLVARDPGPELDDCVDGLVRQDAGNFAVVVVDDGSAEHLAPRLPLDDPRVWLRSLTPPIGADAALRAVAAGLERHEVVVALRPSERPASPDTVARIGAAFAADEGCELLYGRTRTAWGHPGAAEPAESEAAFTARGPALAGESPLAFRAGLAQRAPHDGDLRTTLWHAAGFRGTRFLDQFLTISDGGPGRPAPASRRAGPATPKVSCLMVTGDRLALAKRAVHSFAEQTYPNRELVVVTDGPRRLRAALERHVAALGLGDSVRFVYPDEDGLPLGRLRNLSLDAARGDFVCQWDDDDYSHPERLERQLALTLERRVAASFFTDHLQLLEAERLLFWVDWSAGGTLSGTAELVPGTLMMARDDGFRYPEDGPFARRGEDSVLLTALAERGPVAPLRHVGHLWLYTYHGENTFPREHHHRIAAFGAPRERLLERADRIRAAVAHYPIPRPTVVAGPDGPAFAVR